jgi:flagellar hook assembly protein FlgD
MPSRVEIKIFNSMGQEICTLLDKDQAAGEWSITWDGTDTQHQPVRTGIYYYRLKAGSYEKSRKMVRSGR